MWSLFVAVFAVATAGACAVPPPPPPHMPMHMPNSSAPVPPVAPAAPVAPAVPAVPVAHGEEAAFTVSSVGSCPVRLPSNAPARETNPLTILQQDCWNESAVTAGCDPNADDDCLCGPFFDAVTECVSQTCSIGDSLRTYLPATITTTENLTDLLRRGARHPGAVVLAAALLTVH
jgi:hypothetical protein